MKCECGCGGDTKEGKKFIWGHNSKGNRHREGKVPWNKGFKGWGSGENNPFFGKHHTEENKQINKEKHLGKNNSRYIDGAASLQMLHSSIKKEKCEFCGSIENLDVHHDPPYEYNGNRHPKTILEWNGKLITLCRKCHKQEHKRLKND